MSALTSAIHNTGHYHVRLVAHFLRPFCKQWAQPPAAPASGIARFGDTSRTSGRQRFGMSTAANLPETCCRDAGSELLLNRSLARDRAGTARRRPPTGPGQDKRREVRPGRRAEEGIRINSPRRGALLARSLQFYVSPCRIVDPHKIAARIVLRKARTSVMHVQILSRAAALTRAVCGKRATLLGDADESHRMGGTGQPAGMLSGQLFGPGGNTTPE